MLGSCRRALQLSLLNKRQLVSSPMYKETKLKVLDANINYLETLNSVPNAPPVFFLPGAFGSIETDFLPILPALNTTEYKWFCYDPPGYGKSRPPKRKFCSSEHLSVNIYDIQYIRELMKNTLSRKIFGYNHYTLLAWSGASISGISIASKCPQQVSHLVLWGAFGWAQADKMPIFTTLKKVGLSAIPKRRLAQLRSIYGDAYLLELWNGWCDEAIIMSKTDEFKFNGTYKETIQAVQCPTLIIHGMKDALIELQHAKYLHNCVKHSRMQVIEEGTHNLHISRTKDFVESVHNFLEKGNGKPLHS